MTHLAIGRASTTNARLATKFNHFTSSCSFVLFVVISSTIGGCGGGKSVNVGRRSETKGEPQLAYEQYCKAALDHPGSPQVAASITRVRPSASAYWESQALLQMDQQNYAEAWWMLMKALEIEPDSTVTARMIREIESQHPGELAMPKAQWQQGGNVALAAALKGKTIKPVSPTEPGAMLALGPTIDRPSSALKHITPPEGEMDPPPDESTHESSDEPAAQRPVIKSEQSRRTKARPTSKPPTPTRRAGRERPRMTLPVRPAIRSATGEFSVVETLSLKDRSMPRSAILSDGVEIRLKDTDSDLMADFDLYVGKDRIKKVREMKIGRSQIFAGASGGLYRFTLLGVHHPTATVRVGIKPA